MLTLYAVAHSLYCAKTRIALRHKGLAWHELPPPGGGGSPAYRRIVVTGNLPALDHDGFVLADSEAIAEYLEETFPAPPLLPADPAGRARQRERSRFHDTRLEPALRGLFGLVAPDHRDPALARQRAAALGERLAQLALLLRAGPETGFGLGDCGLPVSFAWIDALTPVLGLEIGWPPALADYRARLAEVPAVAAELAAYAPHVQAWIASKLG
ncbi:glutathione S-transferase family protein [Albidovulum sp.]